MRNMNLVRKLPVIAFLALVGCAGQPHASSQGALPLVGADRDAHGCIGSAGYVWCAPEDACVRPWELAAQRGFAAGEEAFRRHCGESSK
jgi:hypothetical protein